MAGSNNIGPATQHVQNWETAGEAGGTHRLNVLPANLVRVHVAAGDGLVHQARPLVDDLARPQRIVPHLDCPMRPSPFALHVQ